MLGLVRAQELAWGSVRVWEPEQGSAQETERALGSGWAQEQALALVKARELELAQVLVPVWEPEWARGKGLDPVRELVWEKGLARVSELESALGLV